MNKRTATILDLHAKGVRAVDIAAAAGCTRANVHATLRRYGRPTKREVFATMQIASVSMDDLKWLRGEAAKIGVPVRVLARSMLVDAIAEARDAGA